MKTKTTFTTAVWLTIAISFCSFQLSAQSGKVQANGITIAYESFGHAADETILLIAGTNAQLTMWSPEFCQALVKKGCRVIRFDNRDIGLSSKIDKAGLPDWEGITKALQEKQPVPLAYTLDDMALDAVGLLDALKIQKAHIVGASMGGMIAQRVAYNHPEHTLSLTSMMAGGGNPVFPMVTKPEVVGQIPLPGPPEDTAAYISRELASLTLLAGAAYPVDKNAVLKMIQEDVKRAYNPDGLQRQGAASVAAFYQDRREQLKTIQVPVLVIHGSEDPLVPLEAGKDVASYIPQSTFEVIEGMGHWPGSSPAMVEHITSLIAKTAAAAQK